MAFADGLPENLTKQIRQYVADACCELQKWVECLRENHIDVIPQSATFFRCGLSVFERPRGVISRLIVLEADYCDPVTYHPRNFFDLQCWSRRFGLIVKMPMNSGMPQLPLGFRYPEKSTDSPWGRAWRGLWAINKNQIYVAPWLQSNESVLIEWEGKKQKWGDTDLVPDDDDFRRCIRLFVQREYARDFEKDYVDAKAYDLEFGEALSDLMIRCRNEIKTRRDRVCDADLAAVSFVSATTPIPAPESITLFGVIGDFGVNNGPSDDVAALVKSWGPEFVVTTGDNNYPAGEADTIDVNVGRNWRPFIHPYQGTQALRSGEIDPTENRFFPVLGNHDLDNASGQPGQPYFDYFNTGSVNERYYDFVWGHCHFFMLNSGLKSDTDGAPVEPDGNDVFSIQAEWLQMKIAQSTSRWKIGVVHQGPFGSNINHYLGQPAARWPYRQMGLDVLLSGHGHSYERLFVDHFWYVVNGSGGNGLYEFSIPVTGSKKRYNADYGAIKGTATCSELRLEFFTRAGLLIDTLVFGGTGTTADDVADTSDLVLAGEGGEVVGGEGGEVVGG